MDLILFPLIGINFPIIKHNLDIFVNYIHKIVPQSYKTGGHHAKG